MPIPSIPEQAHIVARIEELFSEMDKAAETLNTTKQQLAVYRQAVLKEAFGTYPHESMTLEDFIEKPRYGTSKKCSAHCPDNGIPVFRIPNVNYRAGKIDQTDLKYAAFPKDEKASLSLLDGDILMIRSNGSVGLVGRVALIRKDDIEGVYAGYLIRLRVKDESVLIPKYLLYWLSASNARNYIERIAKSTSGVNNINAGEIEQIPIQICALEHQEKVIEQIESHLSVCDSIEQTIAAALQQAEAMRQSILKQAFEGRL
jgi:type I restriction enzyme S subunit